MTCARCWSNTRRHKDWASLLNFPVTRAIKEVSRKNFRRYSALYSFRARTCRWTQARQESVCSIAFVPCHNCVMMFVSVISMSELTPCPTLRCAGWFGDRLRKGSPRTIWDHYGKLEAQAKSLRTDCDGEVSQATPGSFRIGASPPCCIAGVGRRHLLISMDKR